MEKLHINIYEDTKIWFTSDLHFNHRNVIRFCSRPFNDVKEMNKYLISKWNETVGENDIVFILGDFNWFPSSHDNFKLLKQLKGKEIYIIPGNHDMGCEFDMVLEKLPHIHLCSDIVHVYFEDKTEGCSVLPKRICEVVLCHYPLMTWSHKHTKAINLFGHIHSTPEERVTIGKLDMDLPLWKYQMDIGCDSKRDFSPYSLDEIINILKWPFENPNEIK